MFTAKFIKNIFLDAECIKAIGRSGKLTRVFAKQGDLDGSCCIYSLMMMLIFHKKLDWEDLIDGKCVKYEYIGRIQHEFLYRFNGICSGGYTLQEISDRANKCFGSKMCEAYTTEPGTPNAVNRATLHELIRHYLDCKQPVMLGYSRPSELGHSLVSIAYRREAKNQLRLFCLDPSHGVPFMHLWNTVIDLDYLSDNNDFFTDTNYYADEKICVNSFLVIKDNLQESECPF